jgi:hypothetical protein
LLRDTVGRLPDRVDGLRDTVGFLRSVADLSAGPPRSRVFEEASPGAREESTEGLARPAELELAREIARLTGWTDKVWSRRYRAIVISEEEAAQRERLAYVLSHGIKEDLVPGPRDWPGLHAVRALLDGEPIEGLWFDRTQESAARRRGDAFERDRFATPENVVLSPLPCWRHLSPEKQRDRVAEVVREIEEETAARRKRTGVTPLGRAAVLKQDPLERPKKIKKSPAPLFHAASKRVRDDLRASYLAFFAAFREAAEKLRAGVLPVVFPAGSFPPALHRRRLTPAVESSTC